MEIDLEELVDSAFANTIGQGTDDQFSGVVRVEQPNGSRVELARGFADRVNRRPIATSTRFAVASATKGLTALTVMALIEEGKLSLEAPVVEWLCGRLPLIDERVTVGQLLEHTSGIGDYLDEEQLGDIDDHVLDVSAHTLEAPSNYLDLLSPHPQVSAPGSAFAYNNSGYVLLSIIIEQVTGSFHDAVRDRILLPAGMSGAGFFRSDDLPPDVALGYLKGGRTNAFHLPVIGAGDGGIYLGLDDVTALWDELFNGGLVSSVTARVMTEPRNSHTNGAYGMGFWVRPDGQRVWLEGMDPGVSFFSERDPSSGLTYTVMSNTSSGVWPIGKRLRALFG
jgi:CubicO group peptidase (beta-lactamase class C family)